MKNFNLILSTLVFALILLSEAKAQDVLPISPETGEVTYGEVVEVDGVDKGELYKRLTSWAAAQVSTEGYTVTIKDEELGQMEGVGKIPVKFVHKGKEYSGGEVVYDWKVYVKDGRYKYELSKFIHQAQMDLHHHGSGGNLTIKTQPPLTSGIRNSNWRSYKEQTAQYVDGMILKLNQTMKTGAAVSAEDW